MRKFLMPEASHGPGDSIGALGPPEVWRIWRRIESAGGRAWLVGGAVRNLLSKRPVREWDMATTLRPEQMLALFPAAIDVGRRFGTVLLPGNCPVEVTTLRSDGTYSDGRRPDEVRFGVDLTEDLGRRDFTINAMAMDAAGRLIDPYAGRQDLEHGLLRAVGNPVDRFAEDGLRLLRALRFVSELGLVIEEQTWRAMCQHSDVLQRVALQRQAREWRRWWLGPHLDQAIAPTSRLSLALPPLPAAERVVQWPTELGLPERLLAAFLDEGPEPLVDWQQLLSLSRSQRRWLQQAAAAASPPETLAAAADQRRWLAQYPDIWPRLFSMIQWLPDDAGIRVRALRARYDAEGVIGSQTLSVSADQLVQLAGREPGPWLGQLLRALLEAVWQDPTHNEPKRLQAMAIRLLLHEDEGGAHRDQDP